MGEGVAKPFQSKHGHVIYVFFSSEKTPFSEVSGGGGGGVVAGKKQKVTKVVSL